MDFTVDRVRADNFDWSAESGPGADVRRVTEAATTADGRSPLNEAALLALRHHGLAEAALYVARDDAGTAAGFALVRTDAAASREVDLVVAPGSRGTGVGTRLADAVLVEAAGPGLTISAWSHGNHPAAAALAASHGFHRVRDLWVMRRSLHEPLPAVKPLDGVDVRPFRTDDADAFLAVNAAAFAHHPEQGGMTRADLDERMAEPWFDAGGFFLAYSSSGSSGPGDASGTVRPAAGTLLGFHWTKVHDDRVGEVYVVGVGPDAQGLGLGSLLTLTGLHHLQARGLDEVMLYVECDNAPAVKVYQRLGFTHADADTDVMYALIPTPPSA